VAVLGTILLIVAAYLVGAVPWGVVLGKTLKGIDLRTIGSGGTGATNSLRSLGAPIAISVFILDFAKGLIPVIAARWLDLPNWGIALVAIVPAIGHCWSPYIGFKGGKGMATGGGAACGLMPWLVLILLPMIVVVYFTRYVSLASLLATVSGSILMILLAIYSDFPGWWAAAIAGIAIIIIIQHRTNIQRLLAGTERKFGQKVAG
jgi:glycerol-3-phosphate acyltransferase PlsY